jgi:hypothetical protein
MTTLCTRRTKIIREEMLCQISRANSSVLLSMSADALLQSRTVRQTYGACAVPQSATVIPQRLRNMSSWKVAQPVFTGEFSPRLPLHGSQHQTWVHGFSGVGNWSNNGSYSLYVTFHHRHRVDAEMPDLGDGIAQTAPSVLQRVFNSPLHSSTGKLNRLKIEI